MERKKRIKVSVALEKHGKKTGQKIWKALSWQTMKNARKKTEVNLSTLSRLAKKFGAKTFVVPGKVLGSGVLDKSVKVAALEFSNNARKKITSAGGSTASLEEFLGTKPKSSEVMVVK